MKKKKVEKNTRFDASKELAFLTSWVDDEPDALSEVPLWLRSDLIFWSSLASNELNMSTNTSGFTSFIEAESSLNTSVKHSLATSRPSRSTPGAGSTILQKTELSIDNDLTSWANTVNQKECDSEMVEEAWPQRTYKCFTVKKDS